MVEVEDEDEYNGDIERHEEKSGESNEVSQGYFLRMHMILARRSETKKNEFKRY